jgi:hypothetical protein
MRLFENGKIVLAVVLLWIVGSALIFQLGPASMLDSWPSAIFFDMHSDFSDEEGVAALENFGESGRQLYRTHFWTDLVFAILQTIGITALFWYATSKFHWSQGRFRWLVLLIVFFALLDIGENFVIRSALTAYPDVTPDHFSRIRQIVGAKLMAIVIIPLLVLPSLILLLIAAIRSLKPKQIN